MTAWTPVDLLPGLYAGGIAILLWSALRRWYDAVPARILAVFSVVLLILFGPVLFGGKLLVPLDNLRGLTPFHHLPQVEPHGNLLQGDLILLIQPSLAAVRIQLGEGRWPLWNPWVGAGMPLLADPQSQALQPIALAALPMPWPRAAGVMATLRVLLSLTFSFLWMRRQGLGEGPSLAGALAFSLGGFVILWLGWPMANSAAWLPAVLYGLVRYRQEGGRRDFLLLSLATFALLLGGHPETILYAVGLCMICDVKRMALALVLAGAVAAPALLPFVDYLPQTLRASRESAPQMGNLAEHWLPVVAPNAYGNSRYLDYWGLNNTNEDAAGFCGSVTLLAVLLALWTGRRFPQERLFLAIGVLCLVLLSPWGPGTRRLLLPLAWSLCYLGACTLERVRLGEVRRRNVFLAFATLCTVIAWGYLGHPDARLEPLRTGSLYWQARFLVTGSFLLAWGQGKRWTAPVAAVLIAAELLLFHLPANPPMPQRLANVPNGPIRFLEDHLEDYRMAALGRSFPPNTPLLYGLSDARVYNPMAPAAYLDRLQPILAGWWGEIPELGYRGKEDTRLYQDLGVRYLLADPGVRLPLHLAFQDRDGWIYEIPNPRKVNREPIYRPRAFLLGCLLAALGLAAGAVWLVPPPYSPNLSDSF
ncbi:MAG TPA: hypothetical protein VNM67_03835 [Thermoanaerobaculia bacterium]|nr:hypothetical protein [Thermoanaerobaculia bacterium]